MNILHNERNNILNAFKKGIRIDGRNFYKNRSLTIIMGPSKGFCDISQGGSRIIISSLIHPKNQKENLDEYSSYLFDVKFPLKKSSIFVENIKVLNKTNDYIINEIKIILNYIFNNKQNSHSRKYIFNSEEINWVINFKIFIIENHGNLKDLITLGISLISSSNYYSKNAFNGEIFDFNSQFNFKELIIYGLLNFPLSFTFAIVETLEGEYLMLFDPNNYEEYISISTLTIILSEKNDINYTISGLGPGLNESNIKEALRISFKKNYEIRKILKKAMTTKINSFNNKEIVLINE
jgi:exosome complex RNA-binding protein Rrp42 (RNase PH superfamily)